MKKIILSLLALMSALTFAFAQSNSLSIYGSLQSNQRLLFKNGNWVWNENRLDLNFEKNISSNSKFYSDIWLRNIGLPQYYSLSALYNKNITDPWNLEIRQAYFSVYGLLKGKMDLTLGKQIIHWGTADKFNPTNNLNPYDFEDVLDFGRKRGILAFKADYYINDNNYIEAVFVPFFKPDNLPAGIFTQALQNQVLTLPQNITLTSSSDSLIIPNYKLDNSFSAGIRFKGFLAGFDYSLSYVYGYDQLPVPYKTDISLVPTSLTLSTFNASAQTYLDFYRQHIFGADFAGNINGIGVWGEAALFIPTKNVDWQITTYLPAVFNQPPQTKDSTLFATNKPYVKYVLGADYTFANGMYLNVQFLHGFLHERWQKHLNDYLFIRLEQSFFNNKLKISPLTAAFMISDWKKPKDNYAIAYFPQIIYKPTDNVEITLASALFTGKGHSFLSNLSSYNMFILNMKYSF